MQRTHRLRHCRRFARPHAHLLHLAEDALDHGVGGVIGAAVALIRLDDERGRAGGIERAGERRVKRRLVGDDPDQLRGKIQRILHHGSNRRFMQAHLMHLALLQRAGMHVDHQIRAGLGTVQEIFQCVGQSTTVENLQRSPFGCFDMNDPITISPQFFA